MKRCGIDESLFSSSDIKNLFNKRIKNKSRLDSNIYGFVKNPKIISFLKNELGKIYFDDEKNIDSEKNIDNELNKQRLVNEIIDRSIDIITKYHKRGLIALNEKIKLAELYKDLSSLKNLQEEKIIISNEIMKVRKLQELKR